MQLGYSQETPIALPGMPDGPGRERSYRNPLLAPIWTFLVAGTATDGPYTVTLTDDETGDTVTVPVERDAGVPATNADIAAALQGQLAALGSPWSRRFAASVVTATGTIAFRDPQRGRAWTVTGTAPAPGTITLTETQSEGGASVPMGVWIKRETGTDETLARLVAGDTVADLVGVTLRPLAAFIENPGDRSVDARDLWPVGEIVPVRRRGWLWVEVEEAVTPDSTPFVRVDASTTGVSGAMRATADGGAAIDASSKCRFLRSASAGGLALLEIFDAA